MKNNELNYTINTDGGSRGNPGQAAIGIVIQHNDLVTHQIKRAIGIKTNNYAEYTAVKEALLFLQNQLEDKTCEAKLSFFLDSELVVRQLTGVYKIKDTTLLEIFRQIKKIQSSFSLVTYTHIRRELNKAADLLVNQALDEQSKD